jgi:hypothetical protein
MIYAIHEACPVCNAAIVVVNATTGPYWVRGLWWCAYRKCGRTGMGEP